MNNKVNRMDKLNEEFKKDIYEVISRKIKNPFITEMFSILEVDTSKDLKSAKVYVSIFSTNEEKKNVTFNAIKEDAKKIRYELSKIEKTRTVPELRFILDGSMEYGDKMDKLFNEIHKKEEK